MKQKRAKSYRKQMAYYQLNFKFREPYQVLVDEEIILEAVKTKFDLVKGLQRTFQGEVKPMITQCTIQHLYQTKSEAAIELAKTFERRRCGHLPIGKKKELEDKVKEKEKEKEKEGEDAKDVKKAKPEKKGTMSAYECMAECVNIKGQNKHRYCVATQKPKLRMLFRRVPGVPLVYINRAVMIMEPMSPVTEQTRDRIEKEKLTKGLNDPTASFKHARDENDGNADGNGNGDDRPAAKKRKGPKEPNPLSLKKKKPVAVNIVEKKEDFNNDTNGSAKKRRRKHKRSDKTGADDSGAPSAEVEQEQQKEQDESNISE